MGSHDCVLDQQLVTDPDTGHGEAIQQASTANVAGDPTLGDQVQALTFINDARLGLSVANTRPLLSDSLT
jgi:hypothetical protein